METLTKADLQLMLEIQHPRRGGREFDKVPTSPVRASSAVSHHDLFTKEDDCGGTNIFSNFNFYNKTADDKTLAAVQDLSWQANDNKQTPVGYLFKSDLQRPRPMQMALRFGFHSFEYFDATSSLTPSMCSGHCLQGLISVGAVIERFLDDGVDLTPDLTFALSQWAVDIGDRRVMAGVHYPTDSLCSWVLFLRMAESVYHRPEVRDILSRAITSHSYIHREILRFAETEEGQVYKRPLRLLESSLSMTDLTDPADRCRHESDVLVEPS
jgi:hypothetical protein